MTPIESRYDIRLLTLIGVTINVLETLSLELDADADKLLAEYLYLTSKQIHEQGANEYLDKLTRFYPMLEEAIS